MFENRRKGRNAWRKYAMYLGLNMRSSDKLFSECHSSKRKQEDVNPPGEALSDDLGRSRLRAEPGRLLKRADFDFRRRVSFADKLLGVAIVLILIAFLRCLLGDCVPFEVVSRMVLRPLTGGHL